MTRLERLAERLEEPLLVVKPVNVRYLTGLDSSNAALLVERDRVRLFTDFRYLEKAREVEGVEVVPAARPVHADVAKVLSGCVGFEAEHLPYADHEVLQRGSGAELVPRKGIVEAMRAIKEDDELAAIRRAAAVTTAAFLDLAREPFVGRTEKELAWRVAELVHEHGGDGLAFDAAVAAGENGARPHADTGDRPIAPGVLVTVDAGAAVGGYASDCTRTFAAGDPPARLLEAYEVCVRAQQAGLEAVRGGVAGRDADAAARAVIDEGGFGEFFGHGLGHGLGMEVHEAPNLRPESDHVLDPGSVCTVEPGIYIPGLGGMRVEDLVVVTADGCEVLTPLTKELVAVE